MKLLVWGIVTAAMSFAITWVAASLGLRHLVIKAHGLSVWKAWK